MFINDEIEFYIQRILHYRSLIDKKIEKANGFGVIKFVVDKLSIQWHYDFWFEAMTRFIGNEKCRMCKLKKENKSS